MKLSTNASAVRVQPAAQMLSISRAAFYRVLSAGEMEAVKYERSTLITIESLRIISIATA